MKVLMVNKFHYLRGGSETYHFSVGKSLEEYGCTVAWFGMEDPKNLACKQSCYFVSSVKYDGANGILNNIKAGLSLIYSQEAKRKFNSLLEEFEPDIIHINLVHRQLTFSIIDAPYLKEHRVPIVYTAHDYILVCPACTMLDGDGEVCDECLSGDFSACVRKRCVKGSLLKSILATEEARFLRHHGSYRKIDRIIAPSMFMRDKLLDGGFPSDQIVCMQNFAKSELLECASIGEDKTDRDHPYLLFFGRLSKEKGIDILVKAFLQAIPELPDDLRLIIAGDGPEYSAIASSVASTSPEAAGRIEMIGFQDRESIQQYVGMASLSIVCSRCRENMPYSIVESFALGTPVVGSNIGGIPELVMEGSTGFICEPDDVDSLAQAIIRGYALCCNNVWYAELQQRCRSYVLDRCSQVNYINELLSLYKQLIDAEERSVSIEK